MVDIEQPKKKAAGVPAVLSSFKFGFREMGPARTGKVFLKMNQDGGLRLPGLRLAGAGPQAARRRVLRERRQGRRRGGDPRRVAARVLRRALRRPSWTRRSELLARPAGPAHRADAAARRRDALRAGRAGTRPSQVVARELNALDSTRTRPSSTPPAGPATRPRSSTSSSSAPSAPTTCPTARTCATSRPARRCREAIGSRQGQPSRWRPRPGRADHRRRPEPGHQPPRMLSHLEKAKRNGADIVTVNPLPEAGLMRFKNPQTPARLGRQGHRAGRPVPADPDRRRPGAVPGRRQAAPRGRGGAPGDRARPGLHRAAHQRLRGVRRADAEPTGRPSSRDRAAPRGDRGSRASGSSPPRRRHRLLGDGPHPAQHAVPTIREIVNFLLLRGNIGRPGAGVCPVRGHSQRPGRPHHGHLREAPDPFLDALDARVRLHLAARARLRRGRRRSGDCATARPGLLRHGRQLRRRHTRHRGRAPRRPAARAGLTVHVSTKLNRSHAVTGARALILPTLGRTDQRHPGGRRAVRDRRGLHGHGARVTRQPDAPASRSCLSEIGIVCAAGARRLGPGYGADPLGGLRGGLRRDPRPHRAGSSPASRTSTTGVRASRAASAAARRRATRASSRRPPARPTSPRELVGRRRAPGRLLLQTMRSPRPVQHHDLRPRRPLPRHQGRPPGRLRQPRRPRELGLRRRRVRRHRQRVERRRRAAGAGLPARRLPDRRAAARPRTTRRPTCWCRSTTPPTPATPRSPRA